MVPPLCGLLVPGVQHQHGVFPDRHTGSRTMGEGDDDAPIVDLADSARAVGSSGSKYPLTGQARVDSRAARPLRHARPLGRQRTGELLDVGGSRPIRRRSPANSALVVASELGIPAASHAPFALLRIRRTGLAQSYGRRTQRIVDAKIAVWIERYTGDVGAAFDKGNADSQITVAKTLWLAFCPMLCRWPVANRAFELDSPSVSTSALRSAILQGPAGRTP